MSSALSTLDDQLNRSIHIISDIGDRAAAGPPEAEGGASRPERSGGEIRTSRLSSPTPPRPLHELVRRGKLWRWDAAHQIAFDRMKEILIRAPILAMYKPEFETLVEADT
ncbi:hypothetical protein E4U56_002385 [Claviceps arundinis]|uniref:Uncharacterized protein n=1 Tax=Claviceps arundinis TaxID=1623583 RepID=A0A9P7MQ73_9HYPO|nr:hypothetical protein E4U56_002385 [Claviceps arundinis]